LADIKILFAKRHPSVILIVGPKLFIEPGDESNLSGFRA
jgi:hypothetical protein